MVPPEGADSEVLVVCVEKDETEDSLEDCWLSRGEEWTDTLRAAVSPLR